MNKIVIAIIAALLIAAGGAAYFLTRDGESSSNANDTAQQATNNTQAFEALDTTQLDVVATISGQSGGKDITGVMEYDKDSSSFRYKASAGEQNLTIIYTKDAYYTCQGDNTCFKFAINDQNSGFNPGSYTYDQAKLDQFKNQATYQGSKPCPAGTCDVWKVNAEGYDSTFYVDHQTKRISQVEATREDGAAKITFDYKDVAIVPPANAQSLSTNH